MGHLLLGVRLYQLYRNRSFSELFPKQARIAFAASAGLRRPDIMDACVWIFDPDRRNRPPARCRGSSAEDALIHRRLHAYRPSNGNKFCSALIASAGNRVNLKNAINCEENMKQRRTDGAVLEKHLTKIDAQSPAKQVYVFRCNQSGLYAFTTDREGRMLPSQMYPQITWRFEHTLMFRLDGNSWRDQILRVTLDSVAERGFHLMHAALYGELLGFITQHSATVL
jgi:hypothetical protein